MTTPQKASLLRRLASLVYEALLLVAVLFAAGLIFALIFGDARSGSLRLFSQAYLLLVAGVYFVWQWLRGGQTLPMKTWKMRVVMDSGMPLSLRAGILRYVFAVLGLAGLGLGFLWAVVDRDRQFLHDRLAGTRITMVSGEPRAESRE